MCIYKSKTRETETETDTHTHTFAYNIHYTHYSLLNPQKNM